MKNFIISLLCTLFIAAGVVHAQTAAQKYSAAMDAYNTHRYAEAEKLFDKFFKTYELTDELYATAKYYSADALLKLGENDAAAAGFEFLVNHFTWSAFRDKALYELGIIYFKQKQYDRSRDRFVKLLDDYPESDYAGSSYYWIGETFSKQNRLEDAIEFLKDAITKHQYNKYIDYSIYTLARIYETTGDYRNAVKYYDNLLSYHGDSPLADAAHIRIGVCYFKLKEYDSSVLELNNPVLKDLPESVYSESIYMLANSYYRLNQYSDAERAYLEIMRRFPSTGLMEEVKYGLAWTYFQEKKYNESYKLFNNLSEGTDSLAEKSFFWKAEAKRYAGQENDAFRIYQEFMKRFPDSDMMKGVQYQLGILYYNNRKFDLALKYLRSAVISSDNSIQAKAYTLMGEIELDEKHFEEAKKEFHSAMNTPDITEDLINRAVLGLGAADYFLHNYSDAISNLTDISFRNPNFEKDKVNFYLAECYYAQGNYKDAVDRYDKVSRDNEKLGSMALYGKAYCYFETREYALAARAFSDYIREYPGTSREVDARLRLADSYYGTKNFAASSRIYKEMFNIDKRALDNPYAYYQYAQALYKANEMQNAIDEFRTLQRKFPSSEYADKALYVIGWIYFQQGNYETAISSYRNALQVYPNSSIAPIINYSIGDSYFNLGQYDSAIVSYQQVMINFPGSPHVYDAVNGIQDSYVAENHPEKAVKFLTQFLQNNPGLSFSDQLAYKRGDIYYSTQDYKDAQSSYQDFIVNYPNSKLVPQAYYWIGKCLENLNQNQDAIFNFNKVFISYPSSESAPAAVIEMGKIYNQLKQYDKALGLFDSALTVLPNKLRFPEIMFMKGMTLINKKDMTAAGEVFNQIVQNYDGTIFAEKSKLELGLILLAAKQYQEANTYFQDLAQNRTDEIGAQAQYYIGQSYYEQKDYNDAITALVRVGTIFPAYDEWVSRSYLKLGDCYAALKDKVHAKEMYRTVFTKHRGDDLGKEALTKLRKLK